MPRHLSWQDCSDAGMTATEAARAKGRTVGAAYVYARRHGLSFRPAPTADPQAVADALAIHALQHRADALESIGRSDLIR